jgi:hypothetical protein
MSQFDVAATINTEGLNRVVQDLFNNPTAKSNFFQATTEVDVPVIGKVNVGKELSHVCSSAANAGAMAKSHQPQGSSAAEGECLSIIISYGYRERIHCPKAADHNFRRHESLW